MSVEVNGASSDEYILYKGVHDRLGDHVNHRTLHDVEVGGNKELCAGD